jgi:pimeloyl-ACP methyl ester carboxylesterase
MEIFYEMTGQGPPLVLLNGVMMTTQSWVLQTRRLSPHFQFVLHDFRGQLRSDKPPGPYSLEQHVDDLAALLDHLELPRVDIAGTSYGGEVGMLFAARHPERVSRLAAIASVSHIEEDLRAKVAAWSKLARTSPETLYELSAVDNFSARFRDEHPEVLFAGRERLRACPEEFFIAFAELCDSFLRLDLRPELPRITCPTLVIAEARALQPCHRERDSGRGAADHPRLRSRRDHRESRRAERRAALVLQPLSAISTSACCCSSWR